MFLEERDVSRLRSGNDLHLYEIWIGIVFLFKSTGAIAQNKPPPYSGSYDARCASKLSQNTVLNWRAQIDRFLVAGVDRTPM